MSRHFQTQDSWKIFKAQRGSDLITCIGLCLFFAPIIAALLFVSTLVKVSFWACLALACAIIFIAYAVAVAVKLARADG